MNSTPPASLMRPMMIAKIHRATVTQADLHYVGSITVDADLLRAADLVVLPEAYARDFGEAGSDISAYAEPVDGPPGFGPAGADVSVNFSIANF